MSGRREGLRRRGGRAWGARAAAGFLCLATLGLHPGCKGTGLVRFGAANDPEQESAARSAPEARCEIDPPAGQQAPPVPMEQQEQERIFAPTKHAWERALGGQEAARIHIQARLRGWPAAVLADRKSLPDTDDEFLRRLAWDTWRGLDALTDRENGLPIDHVRFAPTSTDVEGSRIADYTSGTNIGLHLASIVAAHDLGFVSEANAIARIGQLLDTLDRLESHEGFFFNFYDTTTLERTTGFLSFVDSSWLTAGLIVVRQAFPVFGERLNELIEARNLRFFYDPENRLMYHGYDVDRRAYSVYHYGALYSEARIGSLIAIGKGDVPEKHWYAMMRTFPEDCAWQTLTPRATRTKVVRGHEVRAGYYEWKGYRYVPSWGGSMFEALMPTLFLDEPALAPTNLGRNDTVHAEVQRVYALEDLGYAVWGMSPSATPEIDGYAEYGVPVLGSRGYATGVVTPHACALALDVTPEPAVANLRRLAELYDIYGEYGFYDAVDPRSGDVAYEYFALDQSMLFLAIANHLQDGSIQRRFAADPILNTVIPMLSDEDFCA